MPMRNMRASGLLLLALLAALLLSGCQTAPPATPPGDAQVVAPVEPTPPPPPPLPPPPPKPPVIGLALGGGAARGFAHIGVIQVLEEAGIRPQLAAGTSAGSLVAALWASGLNGDALARLAVQMDEGDLADWAFPGRGLLRGDALARYVRLHTGRVPIERMPRALGILATDLDSGEPVLFRRGDTGVAVQASSAVPAFFRPVAIGGREYVDGGLVAPVPVSWARQMGAGLVVAVDISEPTHGAATQDALRMLLQTFSIMGRRLNHHELALADIVIRPDMTGLAGTDFGSRQRALAAGRQAALLALPALRQRIAALTR
ncbi:MAG: patatin-like phospholipase family protein [Rubrivivax sp.]|nr:patatin-like phospholipase family protein [Rubrivivax sp.]